MSDKAEKKPEAGKEGEKKEEKKGGGLLTKLPVLLGGVMLIEAVVLFAGFKFLGAGAKPTQGADITDENKPPAGEGGAAATGAGDKKKVVELKVLDFRCPNKVSGRTFLYDGSIYAVTTAENADKVKQTLADRGALIQDRVRTIIAQADPEKLGGGSEPGLETLRRQVKFQLDEIVGDGMITEVLVPKCTPFRADY